MNRVTCPRCGTAVADDDVIISGTCPVCDSPVSFSKKYKEPDDEAFQRWMDLMDRIERGEFG